MKVLSDCNPNHPVSRDTQDSVRPPNASETFKPELNIDDISVSKQIYPDNGNVEETDISDSNCPHTEDSSQDQDDNLDQGILGNEYSDERSSNEQI